MEVLVGDYSWFADLLHYAMGDVGLSIDYESLTCIYSLRAFAFRVLVEGAGRDRKAEYLTEVQGSRGWKKGVVCVKLKVTETIWRTPILTSRYRADIYQCSPQKLSFSKVTCALLYIPKPWRSTPSISLCS